MKNDSEELEKIINDKFSGSREILYNLNKHFLSRGISNFSVSMLKELREHFKEFSAIENYLQQLVSKIENQNYQEAEKFINDFEKKEVLKIDRIYESIKIFLKNDKSIITISNSFTLLQIFKKIKEVKNDFRITISEGRPNCEGKIFAEKLSKSGIKINFITEAMIPEYVEKSDAAIIGADAVLKNGNVINKTGSLSLAIACRYYEKPFLVIADKSKFKEDNDYQEKIKNPDEIFETENKYIFIRNYYFEKIEKKLITKIFTD